MSSISGECERVVGSSLRRVESGRLSPGQGSDRGSHSSNSARLTHLRHLVKDKFKSVFDQDADRYKFWGDFPGTLADKVRTVVNNVYSATTNHQEGVSPGLDSCRRELRSVAAPDRLTASEAAVNHPASSSEEAIRRVSNGTDEDVPTEEVSARGVTGAYGLVGDDSTRAIGD